MRSNHPHLGFVKQNPIWVLRSKIPSSIYRKIQARTCNAPLQGVSRPTIKRGRNQGVGWMTWWPWRGPPTRSHPELGREKPQRPWYCVLRRGRVGRRQVFQPTHLTNDKTSRSRYQIPLKTTNAGWSSPVARQAHNLKVIGSNPIPATKFNGVKSQTWRRSAFWAPCAEPMSSQQRAMAARREQAHHGS